MSLRRRSTEQDELLGAGTRQQNLGTPPPRRRRRRGRLIHPQKILRYFGGLALLGALIYGGLALLIDGERLRPRVEAELSSATGRRVQIGSLSFSVRRLALKAADLTVAEDSKFGGHVPFLQARSASFKVRLAPLIFSHDVQVTDVSIDGPIVVLRQDAAGDWNFYSLLNASRRNIAELDPPSIQVTDGRLSVAGFGDDSRSFRLRNIRLSARALSLQLSNPLTLTANVEGGGSVKIEGRAGPTEWEQGGPLVPFSGLVHGTNVSLSESNIVSSAPSVGGQFSFDASIESDGRVMRLDGQGKAVKLKVAAAGLPAPEPLQAVFAVSHDFVRHAGVVRCDVRVSKGTVGLTGKYVSGGQSPLLNLALTISDAPVTDLAPFLPALGFPLPGLANLVGGTTVANLKFDGALEGPYVAGSLSVNGARMTGFDLSQRLSSIEGLDASDLNTQFEIVSWKSDLKTGNTGLNLENLGVAVAGLGLLTGSGTIAPDSRIDFKMNGIRGLTGPKGMAIPFTVRGTCSEPVFRPGR
jgi:AsmA protein